MKKKVWANLWPYLLILLAAGLAILPQLLRGVVIMGGDTYFHFSRFYDTAMQIKTGHWSLFQTNFGFHQSGRIINAVYGPAFAYLNGLLALIAGTWFNYQILTDFLICLLAGSSMLFTLRYVGVRKTLATVIAIIFLNVGMIPAYVNGSSFNGWGQALMPLVLYCGVRMLKNTEQPVNFWQLAIVMSLMAQVHVLSTLMAAILLIPFWLVALVTNSQQRRALVVEVIKAVLLTLVLTLNVWPALLYLMRTNHLATPVPYNMAFNGVHLSLYQPGFEGTLGSSYAMLEPLLALAILAVLLHLVFHWRENLLLKVSGFWGLLLLVISSNYWPWGFIQRHFPFLKTSFQFPFRLVVIAYPLLLLALAIILEEMLGQKGWQKSLALLAAGLVLAETFSGTVMTNHHYALAHIRGPKAQAAAKSRDLGKFFLTKKYGHQPDYLPIKGKQHSHQLSKLYKKCVVKRSRHFDHRVLPGGKLQLTWTRKKPGKIILPLVLYRQSRLEVNGRAFTGSTNAVSCPAVPQKPGKNQALLQFMTPSWFKVLVAITMISWLAVLIYFCKQQVDEKSASR